MGWPTGQIDPLLSFPISPERAENAGKRPYMRCANCDTSRARKWTLQLTELCQFKEYDR